MSNGGVDAIDNTCSSSGVKFRLGTQRRGTWELEQEYPRPQNRRKLGRRASSVVACLWGRDKVGKLAKKRSESFSERQTYRAVSWKSLDITVITPDGETRRVVGDERMQVWDLVAPFAVELRLQEPRLYMAESGAPVDCSAPASLLDGEPLLLQEGQVPWDARSATDVRLRIVEDLLSSEKDYCHTLKTVSDLYEKPLRKLLSMEKEDYKSLFDWVEPICSLSKMVIIKLNVAIEEWESYETKVASIFSKLLWTKYEEYQNLYTEVALPLLREKETTDEDFVALCQLRRGAAKHSLAGLLHLPVFEL